MMALSSETLQFSYEYDAKTSYMVLKVKRGEKILHHQIQMVANNPELSIVPFHIRQRNGEIYCYYDITSKQKLSQILQRRKLDKEELIAILLGIGKVIMECDNYLLSDKGFLLKEDFIYLSSKPIQVYLTYIPIYEMETDVIENLRCLMGRLVTCLDIEEDVNQNFFHTLLMEVNRDTFNVGSLYRTLVELKKEKEDVEIQPSVINTQQPSKEYDAFVPQKIHFNKYRLIGILSQILVVIVVLLIILQTGLFQGDSLEYATVLGLMMIIGVAEYFIFTKILQKNKKNTEEGRKISSLKKSIINNKDISVKIDAKEETEMVYFHCDTVLLESDAYKKPYLEAVKKGMTEKIWIDKDSFVIGKIKEQVDYVIPDKGISRIHAEILFQEGDYYIIDLNSKNGTFVNDIRIESNKSYLLKHEDKITFANREYIFKFL